MSVFVDTNILLRSIQPSHPLHGRAVRAVTSLIDEGESLVLTPQIVAEFCNVATRPMANNGLGMTHDEVRTEVASLERFVTVLSESPEVYREWKRLVLSYGVSGVKVHDTRLVAAMLVYDVRRMLTFNGEDFRRYGDVITVIEP